jgi:hypothetical protein
MSDALQTFTFSHVYEIIGNSFRSHPIVITLTILTRWI